MIVWGGNSGEGGLANEGGRYNPVLNSWILMTTKGGPEARTGQSVVWTGSQMLLWGGQGRWNFPEEVYSYTPGSVLYLYQRP